MRTITTNIYTIDEHPNPELCFDWMRNNYHDLNDHGLQEMQKSIAALSECIGGTNDYEFGVEPSRGQFISFMDFDIDKLMALDADDCSLTGSNYDYSVIKAMQDLQEGFTMQGAGVRGYQRNMSKSVFFDLHSDTEYIYSEEGLNNWAYMAELEFMENGTAI